MEELGYKKGLHLTNKDTLFLTYKKENYFKDIISNNLVLGSTWNSNYNISKGIWLEETPELDCSFEAMCAAVILADVQKCINELFPSYFRYYKEHNHDTQSSSPANHRAFPALLDAYCKPFRVAFGHC